MKQFFGVSQSGNLKEAVRGLHNPQMLLLMSNPGQFEQHVEELEKLFPQVPSIGCIGMSYDTRVVEKGVGVVAFCDGVKAAANVLEQVSSMPVKYIQRLQQDVRAVGASQRLHRLLYRQRRLRPHHHLYRSKAPGRLPGGWNRGRGQNFRQR